MTRLLEQPRAPGLGLAKLLRRLRVRPREQLASLLVRRSQDLRTLPLAVHAVALDVGLLRLDLALAAPDLLLGTSELRRRGVLGVALERVGELGRGTNQMEGVHPHGMAGGLDVRGAARGLDHPQLSLELGRVAAEGVERVLHLLAVVAVARGR